MKLTISSICRNVFILQGPLDSLEQSNIRLLNVLGKIRHLFVCHLPHRVKHSTSYIDQQPVTKWIQTVNLARVCRFLLARAKRTRACLYVVLGSGLLTNFTSQSTTTSLLPVHA